RPERAAEFVSKSRPGVPLLPRRAGRHPRLRPRPPAGADGGLRPRAAKQVRGGQPHRRAARRRRGDGRPVARLARNQPLIGPREGGMVVEALLEIQDRHGYLPDEEVRALAEEAGSPLYRLQEVISFFPHFRRAPPPPVTVSVCTGLSCERRG